MDFQDEADRENIALYGTTEEDLSLLKETKRVTETKKSFNQSRMLDIDDNCMSCSGQV